MGARKAHQRWRSVLPEGSQQLQGEGESVVGGKGIGIGTMIRRGGIARGGEGRIRREGREGEKRYV